VEDVRARFERAARGRHVTMESILNRLLTPDFDVRYDDEHDAFLVAFTDAGCFEEAYRFIERWIERRALELDGEYMPPPADHADFTTRAAYWPLERCSEQLFADLEAAVESFAQSLEGKHDRSLQLGDVLPESRIAALRGLVRHFDHARQEIRRAVLSPHTMKILSEARLLSPTSQG
jgi:hypothetical protein